VPLRLQLLLRLTRRAAVAGGCAQGGQVLQQGRMLRLPVCQRGGVAASHLVQGGGSGTFHQRHHLLPPGAALQLVGGAGGACGKGCGEEWQGGEWARRLWACSYGSEHGCSK
jgi:hypothetical protein